MLNVNVVAEICHEANRVYCNHTEGIRSQVPWWECPQWQKDSAVDGVNFFIANPGVTPAQMHDNWSKVKLDDGWVYGEVKDAEKKTHPCLVEYHELPLQQRLKDSLFSNICKALLRNHLED